VPGAYGLHHTLLGVYLCNFHFVAHRQRSGALQHGFLQTPAQGAKQKSIAYCYLNNCSY
jgi:hypothetical protein